jgi:hypothetical protein
MNVKGYGNKKEQLNHAFNAKLMYLTHVNISFRILLLLSFMPLWLLLFFFTNG